MPRISAEAQAAAGVALPGPPLEPPPDLTEEQAADWRSIVATFPAEWFRPDHVPVLRELVRHMAYSRMLGEQLALLRHCSLTRHAKSRAIFAQLLAMHRDQSMRIAALSTKLRLTPQTQEESRKRAAERRRTPTNAIRPWEDWGKRDDGDGQH